MESLPDPITPVEAILRRCSRLQVRACAWMAVLLVRNMLVACTEPVRILNYTNCKMKVVLYSYPSFYLGQVMEHYVIPEFADVQEFLSHLGKRLGKLKKGECVWNGVGLQEWYRLSP